MSWTKLAVTGLVLLGLLIVWMTHQVWAAAFLGVLFALSLNGPGEWLRQHVRMPAWVATGLVLLVVLATLTGLGWTIGPSLAGQAEELTRKHPDATQNMVSWLERRPWGQRVIERAVDWSGISQDDLLDEARGSTDRSNGTHVALVVPASSGKRTLSKANASTGCSVEAFDSRSTAVSWAWKPRPSS